MATFQTRPFPSILLSATLLLASSAFAHGGHDEIPEGAVISDEPTDSTLWAHIIIQVLACGILVPIGIVLGLARSRWHVPVQVVATALAVLGYFMGHLHKGRQFGPNAHAKFANLLMLILIVQVVIGGYLRLHIERGFLGKIRKLLIKSHGILGGILPVAVWVQMLLGGIASQGFCQGEHEGQCAAHFIMGSAFIGYGIVLTLLLLNGQAFLARTGRSQEFWDSLIIALWGCVNSFTGHRWGTAWVKNDIQHTSMGNIWGIAGLVGIWLSHDRQGRPRRNLIPGVVIMLTGWGISAHPQESMLRNKVYIVFGYTLMSAGLTRIIEISFILRDRTSLVGPEGGDVDAEINSFQYLPVFLLYASGFLLMSATEEQTEDMSAAGFTHVSYSLLSYSASFSLFLFVLMLLYLYSYATSKSEGKRRLRLGDEEVPLANGRARIPNNMDRRSHDAQEFEFDGLMSDRNSSGFQSKT